MQTTVPLKNSEVEPGDIVLCIRSGSGVTKGKLYRVKSKYISKMGSEFLKTEPLTQDTNSLHHPATVTRRFTKL